MRKVSLTLLGASTEVILTTSLGVFVGKGGWSRVKCPSTCFQCTFNLSALPLVTDSVILRTDTCALCRRSLAIAFLCMNHRLYGLTNSPVINTVMNRSSIVCGVCTVSASVIAWLFDLYAGFFLRGNITCVDCFQCIEQLRFKQGLGRAGCVVAAETVLK